MSELSQKNCVPCRGGTPPLKGKELAAYSKQVPAWQVTDEHQIARTFKLPDFKSALALVNRIGDLAEQQGHHPDIELAWGKVKVILWTHAVGGLSESDFIMAAKIDDLAKKEKVA